MCKFSSMWDIFAVSERSHFAIGPQAVEHFSSLPSELNYVCVERNGIFSRCAGQLPPIEALEKRLISNSEDYWLFTGFDMSWMFWAYFFKRGPVFARREWM
jgi:hypothetical protein